jgi:hypothetical protein
MENDSERGMADLGQLYGIGRSSMAAGFSQVARGFVCCRGKPAPTESGGSMRLKAPKGRLQKTRRKIKCSLPNATPLGIAEKQPLFGLHMST